jgi:hypothetical protein
MGNPFAPLDPFGLQLNNTTPNTPRPTITPLSILGGPTALGAATSTSPSVSPVVQQPQVTPGTMTIPPAAATPPPTPPINKPAAFFGSVMSLIDGAVKPNALNKYFQSAYHFRLFAAPDMDPLSQTEATTIQDFYTKFQTIKQVTIAESGVTGFNIKDVQFTTKPANTGESRASTATRGTITITEPNGISFLDGLSLSAQALNVFNGMKAAYYLELTFVGYDESGHFIGSLNDQDFSSGGRWIWSIAMNKIEAKLNEGGGVYTIDFVCADQVHMIDNSKHDIMTTPQAFFAKGDTVRALFADYITQLNINWAAKSGGKLVVFEAIKTKAVGSFFAHPPNAAGKDPGDFAMKPREQEKNPNRSWDFDNQTGTYTVNITKGYRIQDFIIDAIKHTEEGQNLAKDGSNITGQLDKSSTEVNDRGFRECIIWSVETVVTQKEFDTTSGNYIQHITFYVIPHYSQKPILSNAQVEQAKTNAVQRAKVQSIVDNGTLKKRYDYVYTGLNTEILDFDMSFNTNFDFLAPAFNGTQMKYDGFHQPARALGKGTDTVDGNADESRVKVTPVTLAPPAPAASAVPPTPVAPASSIWGGMKPNLYDQAQQKQLASAATQTNANGNPLAANSAETSTAATAGTPQAAPANSATKLVADPSGLNHFYIEDLLSQRTASNPSDYAIPISFWQSNNITEDEAGSGSGMVGQVNFDQNVVGAVWAQIYQSSKTNSYNNIKLTIRGDPYWLGQSNIHRSINLTFDNISVAGNDLPDWATGHLSIFLYFRYPMQIGDDFKPALQTSQTFNGLYTVTSILHTFADGVFKQELTCVPDSLIDLSKWSADTSNTNGGNGSSPQLTSPSSVTPPSSGVSPSSLGTQ